MVADGGVTRLRERVTEKRAASSSAPASQLAANLDRYERRYEKCRTNRDRLHVIREIQRETFRFRGRHARVPEPKSPEWRREIALHPGKNAAICARYDISPWTLKAVSP